MKPARRISGVLASLLAVFLASGGHWMVLQSVAWTGMLIDHVRTGTLTEAIAKTFDGKHPCRMCHQIREGRDKEAQQPVLVSSAASSRLWMTLPGISLGMLTTSSRTVAASATHSLPDYVPDPTDPPPRRA